MLIPDVQVSSSTDETSWPGGESKWNKIPSRARNIPSRAIAGPFFSSRAKFTYLPFTANLSRAIFFRPPAIHGPRAPIWEALVYTVLQLLFCARPSENFHTRNKIRFPKFESSAALYEVDQSRVAALWRHFLPMMTSPHPRHRVNAYAQFSHDPMSLHHCRFLPMITSLHPCN